MLLLGLFDDYMLLNIKNIGSFKTEVFLIWQSTALNKSDFLFGCVTTVDSTVFPATVVCEYTFIVLIENQELQQT